MQQNGITASADKLSDAGAFSSLSRWLQAQAVNLLVFCEQGMLSNGHETKLWHNFGVDHKACQGEWLLLSADEHGLPVFYLAVHGLELKLDSLALLVATSCDEVDNRLLIRSWSMQQILLKIAFFFNTLTCNSFFKNRKLIMQY